MLIQFKEFDFISYKLPTDVFNIVFEKLKELRYKIFLICYKVSKTCNHKKIQKFQLGLKFNKRIFYAYAISLITACGYTDLRH